MKRRRNVAFRGRDRDRERQTHRKRQRDTQRDIEQADVVKGEGREAGIGGLGGGRGWGGRHLISGEDLEQFVAF